MQIHIHTYHLHPLTSLWLIAHVVRCHDRLASFIFLPEGCISIIKIFSQDFLCQLFQILALTWRNSLGIVKRYSFLVDILFNLKWFFLLEYVWALSLRLNNSRLTRGCCWRWAAVGATAGVMLTTLGGKLATMVWLNLRFSVVICSSRRRG